MSCRPHEKPISGGKSARSPPIVSARVLIPRSIRRIIAKSPNSIRTTPSTAIGGWDQSCTAWMRVTSRVPPDGVAVNRRYHVLSGFVQSIHDPTSKESTRSAVLSVGVDDGDIGIHWPTLRCCRSSTIVLALARPRLSSKSLL